MSVEFEIFFVKRYKESVNYDALGKFRGRALKSATARGIAKSNASFWSAN